MLLVGNTVDWERWPLVHVHARTIPAHETPTVVGGALRAALDRGQPFAAVLELPEAPARRGRVRGAVEHVRMLKQLRPGLVERCRGLAFVLSVQSQQENAKGIRSGAKLWGCPTTATHDPEAAVAWAYGRLTAPSDTPPAAAP